MIEKDVLSYAFLLFFCSFLHHQVSWREDAKQIGRPPILKLQVWKKETRERSSLQEETQLIATS